MHIAIVSAECAPIAKAGGLGDFVQGLARELARRGEQVEVILPHYDVLKLATMQSPLEIRMELKVPFEDRLLDCRVLAGKLDGFDCLFIDPRSEHGFFERGCIYGQPDDAERFAFFARAVLELTCQPGQRPEILHCNDWQTGLIPVLLDAVFRGRGLEGTRVCYTLHNVGYQGRVDPAILRRVGLDVVSLMAPDRLRDPADPGLANLMQGGIVHADFVNTVSPRYAWEIQHTEQGMGLQALLLAHGHKFGGILNGIDDQVWNPELDPLIPVNYGPNTLPLKAVNRRELRARMGLEESDKPILAVVSRLDRQKGVALIEYGVRRALEEGGQMVLLGSAIEPEIAEQFERLKASTDANPNCRLALTYDESLAHLIYAGSDMILIPSLYEPCGLTQLIAMKYGTVPIARRVGGLADTVFDAHYSERPFETRNGYLFDDPTEEGLESAMSRAIELWKRFPEYFRQLRINGMRGDYSWRQPARRYLEVYAHLLGR